MRLNIPRAPPPSFPARTPARSPVSLPGQRDSRAARINKQCGTCFTPSAPQRTCLRLPWRITTFATPTFSPLPYNCTTLLFLLFLVLPYLSLSSSSPLFITLHTSPFSSLSFTFSSSSLSSSSFPLRCRCPVLSRVKEAFHTRSYDVITLGFGLSPFGVPSFTSTSNAKLKETYIDKMKTNVDIYWNFNLSFI